MKGRIRGTLCIIHADEALHEFTKDRTESLIVVPFATLIDASVYYMAELKARSATDVSYFFKVLERDPYLLDYKIVKRRSNQAALLVTRKQMGTFRALYAADSVLSGPIVIRKGVRYYPIVAPAKNIKQLIKSIIESAPVKTEVWFRADNPAASVGSFHNTFITAQDIATELSYMELKALITAFQLGYFSKPRLQDSREVSKQLGISHSTFNEHLRNAEKKVVRLIVNSLSTAFGEDSK